VKIELKPFQETAARKLRQQLEFAKNEASLGDPQAIVLSSPTGSGKTVTITALMEWIYQGYESFPADPQAVFLWLSDSPELNAQSRDKILSQSSVFVEPRLVMIDSSFDQEHLDAGRVYFLNTQKLGKDSLLTKHGDMRTYTIWETVQNTAAAKPGHFFLVIDEAHRGMTESAREREQATTIVQRFIKGYPEVGLQPVKLVIGMSATPDRFNKLVEGTGRLRRQCEISPDDVKNSGLLKDRIILFYPDENQPADWSLLEAATRRWQGFCAEWKKYCQAQAMERIIEPVLVIQVEDGDAKVLTRTSLEQAVQVVERVTGRQPDGAWTHAFQEDKQVDAGGQKIRKIEASKIETDPKVRIVLFKMSLTTGWDCPRAEVMMSFRKAQDYTLIAQLVGRMVRTPLARTIEGQEFLNSVSLYLPHYDQQGLQAILDKLNHPDPETGVAVRAEDGATLAQYTRAADKAELFDKLQSLPTYRVEYTEKSSNVRRLIKLGRHLTWDGIDRNAFEVAKKLVVKTLDAELRRLSKKSDFVGHLSANQEIVVREAWVEYGEWKDLDTARTVRIKVTPENIDDLFAKCGRVLGEGLHMTFWKAHKDLSNPDRAKLELYGVLQDKAALKKLEEVCGKKIKTLFEKHSETIGALPTSKKEDYNRIKRIAKAPESETPVMPPSIELKKELPQWERHLYVDQDGKFGAKLNKWETAVLQAELAKPEVTGWLRNIPRKAWALCVPYKMGDDNRAAFPDLIIFRTEKKKIIVDLLEPHDSGLPDAVDKAKGLAEYAKRHGDQFGRIELIVVNDNGEIKRLNVNLESIRDQVLQVTSKPHLDHLFQEQP
jgi:type III restriction enzyme